MKVSCWKYRASESCHVEVVEGSRSLFELVGVGQSRK